jgi:hypothetical protein
MLVQIIFILGYAFIVSLFIAGFAYMVRSHFSHNNKPEGGKPFSPEEWDTGLKTFK